MKIEDNSSKTQLLFKDFVIGEVFRLNLGCSVWIKITDTGAFNLSENYYDKD